MPKGEPEEFEAGRERSGAVPRGDDQGVGFGDSAQYVVLSSSVIARLMEAPTNVMLPILF